MDLTSVESGHIDAVGWDDGVMIVRFKNGTDYAYNIGEDDYLKIKDASSVGSALARCGVRGQRC
jgi:hypothetical protein